MYGWDAQLEAARRRVEEIENKIALQRDGTISGNC
jgi:hypothetical protein